MASLTNTKIKNTYVSLLKVADNGQLDAALQDITDGAGNVSGIQLNTGGDLTASGTISFGSLKDSGENITITKFVDAADGIGSNNNDTTIPTSAAVSAYVASQVTLEDLDFAGDSGTGAVDLDSQTLSIVGTANEITTVAGAQTLTIGLPSTIHVNVQGDLTGNVTATSVLVDGVTATTQLTSDNSTKVATTAFVKSVVTAENLDIAGTSGTGSVDLDSQVLTIAGTTNEIETSASGQTITVGLPSDVTIGNNLTVTTNASVGGTLDVTGATGIDGNFDIATNKFTVQAATGNTSVAGTLGVTGTSTLGVINASGLASLDGGIDVDGAFTVSDTTGNIQTSGTLGVTGTTSLTDDLAVDTDTLFVDASADRVGINKNNPAVALDVVGDITSSGTVTGSTVSATTLTGTLSTAAQTNITSVGTLSSLDVSGSATLTSSGISLRLGNATGNSGANILIAGASTTKNWSLGVQQNVSGALEFTPTTTNGATTLGTTPAMVILDSGNVGIGTSSPSYKLDVGGASNIDSTARFAKTSEGSLLLGGNRSTSNCPFIGSENNYDFAFITNNTERMRINSSGSIISTLAGGVVFDNVSGGTNANQIRFQNTGGNMRVGIESSTGGSIQVGTAAYSAVFGNQANAPVDFTTNGTSRMRIDASGNVSITSGNLSFANGSGIDFSASAGGGASSSLLDDYEEGTWTPSLSGFGGGTTIGYAVQVGRYTKIGNLVHLQYRIALNSYSSTAGVNIAIAGMPFTPANEANVYANQSLFAENTNWSGSLFSWCNPNTALIYIASIASGGIFTHVGYTAYSATTTLTGNLFYRV